MRILVAWTPGGGVDGPVRLLLPRIQAALGQPIIVENRGGASRSIGAAYVAQQPADGYTVLADAAAHPAVSAGHAARQSDPLIGR